MERRYSALRTIMSTWFSIIDLGNFRLGLIGDRLDDVVFRLRVALRLGFLFQALARFFLISLDALRARRVLDELVVHFGKFFLF